MLPLRYLELASLGHVKAFPQGFLSGSPELRYLNLDATEAEALPVDFLTRHPRLETIWIRGQKVPALPRRFLAHAPRIQTLGLAMPLLEPLLMSDHRLWDTLQAGGLRVKVTRPDPFYFPDPDFKW